MPTLEHGTGPETGRDAPSAGAGAGLRRAGSTGPTVTTADWAADVTAGRYETTSRAGTATGYETATGGARPRRSGARPDAQSGPRRRVARVGPMQAERARTDADEDRTAVQGRGSAAGRGSTPGRGSAPGTAPAVDDGLPDLDVKRPAPAPRVDATERAEREPGPTEPLPDREPVRDEPDEAERAIKEAFFESGTGLSPHNTAVDRIVDKLYREVERRMQIERERRGL